MMIDANGGVEIDLATQLLDAPVEIHILTPKQNFVLQTEPQIQEVLGFRPCRRPRMMTSGGRRTTVPQQRCVRLHVQGASPSMQLAGAVPAVEQVMAIAVASRSGDGCLAESTASAHRAR